MSFSVVFIDLPNLNLPPARFDRNDHADERGSAPPMETASEGEERGHLTSIVRLHG